MSSTRVHFQVLGVNPLKGSPGFTDGDYLWELSLGRTGDGKFDGETFLGRLWMVFSWGGEGGEEEAPGHVQNGLFFHWTTRVSEQSFLCYYILSSGGFAAASSDHREGAPGPRRPGQRTCAVQASTTRRPVPHIEDSEGAT